MTASMTKHHNQSQYHTPGSTASNDACVCTAIICIHITDKYHKAYMKNNSATKLYQTSFENNTQ